MKEIEHSLQYVAPERKTDRESMFEAAMQNENVLEYSAPECKYDKEIVSEATNESDHACIYAVQNHRANHEIVLEPMRQNEYVPEQMTLPDWKPDYVVVACIVDRPFVSSCRRLWEWARTVVAFASPVCRLSGSAVRHEGTGTIFLVFCLIVRQQNTRRTKDCFSGDVNKNEYAHEHAAPECNDGSGTVTEAMKEDGYAPIYARQGHKRDRETVSTAETQNEYSLEDAAPVRKVDRKFTLEAVKESKKMRLVVLAGATTGGATTGLGGSFQVKCIDQIDFFEPLPNTMGRHFDPLSAVLDPTGTTHVANPAVSSARVHISTNIPIFLASSARTDTGIDYHTQVSSCGMVSNPMTIEKWRTRCNNNNDNYYDDNHTPQLCPGT